MVTETKQQKIKILMNLGIQRTKSSWNKLTSEEINNKYKEAKDLKLII